MKEASNTIKITCVSSTIVQSSNTIISTIDIISWFNQGGMDPRVHKWRQRYPLSIHLQINAIQSIFCKNSRRNLVPNSTPYVHPSPHIISYILIPSKSNRSEIREMIGIISSIKQTTKTSRTNENLSVDSSELGNISNLQPHFRRY
jgi:hypothetical protein